MTEHEKDHLTELKDIDESSVEEIAEYYPMLGKDAKKRILQKCLEKTNEAEFSDGFTVSGTEIYRRPVWSRILSTAAVVAGAAVMVTGALFLSRNRSVESDPLADMEEPTTVVTTSAQTSTTTAAETNTEYVTTTSQEVVLYVETSETIPIISTLVTESSNAVSTDTTEATETTSTDVTTDEDGQVETTTEAWDEITPEFLMGLWISDNSKNYEFYTDGSGGRCWSEETGTGLGFAYELTNGIISFRFAYADASPENGTIERTGENSFLIHWHNGTSEYFSSIGA